MSISIPEHEQAVKHNLKKKVNNVTNTTNTNININASPTQLNENSQHQQSLLQNRKKTAQKPKIIEYKESTINNIYVKPNNDEGKKYIPLPNNVYLNITTDGMRHMDYVCHLTNDQVENTCMERKLRPISGLRHKLRRNRNNKNKTNELNVIEETDLIQRISKITTIKRLDMSSNELKSYPKQLCDLYDLETLNLSNNHLNDIDLPNELERYQNLIEIILDSNCLKTIPKSIMKFKKLTRLSISNNSISDLKNIENLRKIRYLVADNNQINHIDDSITNLDKLELLSLKNNSINFLQASILKSNLNHLKQLDLSFNKIQYIPAELFMLPRLEVLKLSNNGLNKLPVLPVTFKRATTMFLIDLSSNSLTKFYEYLLSLATYIDLSSNKLKFLPSTAIQTLTHEQLKAKTLKLDNNPLEYPPKEVCLSGLKVIKQFFEEAATHIQLNHGFKLLHIGSVGSGKTSLAYALEDFNAQSNLTERFNTKTSQIDEIGLDIPLDTQSLAKFVEVHEFFFKMDTEKMNQIVTSSAQGIFSSSSNSTLSSNSKTIEPIETVTTMPMSIYDMNGSIEQFGHLANFFIDKSALILFCVDITTFDERFAGDIIKAEENLKYWLDVIFFKMSKICNFYLLPVATKCDKYISSTRSSISMLSDRLALKRSSVISLNDKLDDNSSLWIDNSNSFSKENKLRLKNLTNSILEKIHKHFDSRLDYLKAELETIESQTKISASQSDRLKTLANLLNNTKPGMHSYMPIVSSLTMDGISQLNDVIKSIVCNNETYFPNVNKKVPSLWIEVEKFVFSKLNRTPMTRFADDSIRQSANILTTLSGLCIEFDEFKDRIVEKYGMDHMIVQITNYLNSQGKIVWIQDTDYYSTKVFLKPNMLFDLLHALYRKDFNENFTDNHLQVIRTKLSISNNMSEEYVEHLKKELLTKGCAYVDLFKLIWLPIMLSDSSDLIIDVLIYFMAFFNIGYPQVQKSKMKAVFNNVSNLFDASTNNSRLLTTRGYSASNFGNRRASAYSQQNDSTVRNLRSHSRISADEPLTARSNNTINACLPVESQQENEKVTFNCIMIPYYMPSIKKEEKLNEIRTTLKVAATNIALAINNLNPDKENKKLKVPCVCLKYSFPWGLIPGLFERFTVQCIINTDLYYKMHWKNAVYAYNEQNTIGVLMYNKNPDEEDHDAISEIIFEFYVVSFKLDAADAQNAEYKMGDKNEKPSIQVDYEILWNLIMKVVTLFEGMLSIQPGMLYNRHTRCPDCQLYTFLGEWNTPKEVQGLKVKKCTNCENDIDAVYLVKPTSGRNLAMELKKMKQRLENIIQMRTESATLIRSNEESFNDESRLISPLKLLSPKNHLLPKRVGILANN